MLVNIVIYYLYLLIVSKSDNYIQYIETFSECGASESCLNGIKQCGKYINRMKNETCLSTSIFGESDIISELPESIVDPYLDKFYEKDIKNVYFDFILDVLELSMTNKDYYYLYDKVQNSLSINFNKINSDLYDKIIPRNEIFETNNIYLKDHIREKVFYICILNKLSHYPDDGIEYISSLINFNENYNIELLSSIDEKYFKNDQNIENPLKNTISYLLFTSENNRENYKRKLEKNFKYISSFIPELEKSLIHDASYIEDLIDYIKYCNSIYCNNDKDFYKISIMKKYDKDNEYLSTNDIYEFLNERMNDINNLIENKNYTINFTDITKRVEYKNGYVIKYDYLPFESDTINYLYSKEDDDGIRYVLQGYFSKDIVEDIQHMPYVIDISEYHEYEDISPFVNYIMIKDDIRVNSFLNLMPLANPKMEAYFVFEGDNKEKFNEIYEIYNVFLNGRKIYKEQIIYEDNFNEIFRFKSIYYNKNNTIEILFKNKETGEKFIKQFESKTRIVS